MAKPTVNQKLTDIATQIVAEKVASDKVAAACQPHPDPVLRSEVVLEEDNDEDELRKLREARLEQMKRNQRQLNALATKGHGSYSDIRETEFLDVVLGSDKTICHFYHHGFDRCKIMDLHMERLAKRHLTTRFIRTEAEKAPFFVAKLGIRTLPTVLIFVKGAVTHKVVGFSEMGGVDAFRTAQLAKILQNHGGLDEDELLGPYEGEEVVANDESSDFED